MTEETQAYSAKAKRHLFSTHSDQSNDCFCPHEQETERERLDISESEIYVPAGPSLKEKGREMKVFARPAEGDTTRGLVAWDGRGPRSGQPAGELSLAVIQPLTHISGVQVVLCFTYIGVDAIAKMSTKNRLAILFEERELLPWPTREGK